LHRVLGSPALGSLLARAVANADSRAHAIAEQCATATFERGGRRPCGYV
jgi:hypothetical protein